MDDVVALLSKINFGTVPGWLQLAVWVLVLWRGLPAVLDAWSNSLNKESERTDREIKRLEGQLRTMDERHEECVEGQRKLREELNTVYGQLRQIRQIMLSTAALSGHVSPAMMEAFSSLDRVAAEPKS